MECQAEASNEPELTTHLCSRSRTSSLRASKRRVADCKATHALLSCGSAGHCRGENCADCAGGKTKPHGDDDKTESKPESEV